jgi:pimeloyl-ACP methyl ester carboxylesterase
MKNLILLHGALGSAAQLQTLVDLLADDFQVHCLNFPGHGGEPVHADQFNIPAFASALNVFIILNNLQGADVFGYSMGGYVALYTSILHPGLIGSIFTLATKFHWSPESAAKEVLMLDATVIESKIPKYAEMLAKRHHPSDWKTVLKNTAEMMLSLGENPLLDEKTLKQINCKTLISVGDKDQMVSLSETIATYQQIPGAGLAVLPETQHPFEKLDLSMVKWHLLRFLHH